MLNIITSILHQTSGPLLGLKKWDQHLFLQLNVKWTSPFLDKVLPWIREPSNWFFLYLLLFIFIIWKKKWNCWKWILMIIVTICITDQLSSNLFKHFFGRLRPCNDPFMIEKGRLLLHKCPSSMSFTSSHATNHFGAGVFFFITLKPYLKNGAYLFFVWAALISYAQIYVGVHYPLDIICGALIGSMIGLFTAKLYEKIDKKGSIKRIKRS